MRIQQKRGYLHKPVAPVDRRLRTTGRPFFIRTGIDDQTRLTRLVGCESWPAYTFLAHGLITPR